MKLNILTLLAHAVALLMPQVYCDTLNGINSAEDFNEELRRNVGFD